MSERAFTCKQLKPVDLNQLFYSPDIEKLVMYKQGDLPIASTLGHQLEFGVCIVDYHVGLLATLEAERKGYILTIDEEEIDLEPKKERFSRQTIESVLCALRNVAVGVESLGVDSKPLFDVSLIFPDVLAKDGGRLWRQHRPQLDAMVAKVKAAENRTEPSQAVVETSELTPKGRKVDPDQLKADVEVQTLWERYVRNQQAAGKKRVWRDEQWAAYVLAKSGDDVPDWDLAELKMSLERTRKRNKDQTPKSKQTRKRPRKT